MATSYDSLYQIIMDYNWEEIFRSKSTEELYQIYCGNSFLPQETKYFAKVELERRKFCFDDLDLYRKIWKLDSISEEIDYSKFNLSSRRFFTFLDIQIFSLIFLAASIFIFVKYKNISQLPLLLILLLTVSIFIISNYFYVKKKIHLEDLMKKKEALFQEISNLAVGKKKMDAIEEIAVMSNKKIKNLQTINLILAIVLSIIILLRIFL